MEKDLLQQVYDLLLLIKDILVKKLYRKNKQVIYLCQEIEIDED